MSLASGQFYRLGDFAVDTDQVFDTLLLLIEKCSRSEVLKNRSSE
jgi:hypothetical protein